jgi:hypothetical protein
LKSAFLLTTDHSPLTKQPIKFSIFFVLYLVFYGSHFFKAMPESRRRRKHHHYQKASDIPARQRTKPTTIGTIFFAVFGLLIAFFASGGSYLSLGLGAVIGGALGYFFGYRMMKAANKK